jgi:proteasome activator subunit 4
LVGSLGSDCLTHLTEEAVHTDAYTQDTPGVTDALFALEAEFSSSPVDPDLLAEALRKAPIRVAKRKETYDQTVREMIISSRSWSSQIYGRCRQYLSLPRNQQLM